MDFFDRMMDSFSTAGQDVAKRAKTATESVKLNNQIKANERMIKKLIYQVGLLCYENQGKESLKYEELFQEINRLKVENSQMEYELAEITAEKICPQCGFGNDMDVNFCVRCGTNLRDVSQDAEVVSAASGGKKCRNCGTFNEKEALFCVECGARFKRLTQENIEETEDENC